MVQPLDMNAVEQALQGFTIPPQPDVLLHIQQLIQQPEPNIQRLATLINMDIGLAGFTLKVVNSAYFGLRSKITSIEHACKFLGLNRVVKLIRSVLLRFTLEQGQQKDPFSQKLWSNALLVANSAASLARHLQWPQELCDDCYTLGLFRNAGIALITAQAPNYADLVKVGVLAGQSYSESEEHRFHTCHEILGYLIAQSWGLPAELCNVIAYHHSPALILESDNELEQRLFAILKLAEHMSGESRVLLDINLDPEWEQFAPPILDVLQLELFQLPELAEVLRQNELTTIYTG